MNGRIQHVGVVVDNLAQTRGFLEEVLGLQLARAASDTPLRNGPTRSYFTRPDTSRGVVFQILDRRLS
jgi:catechol 2,3-dioxygenase-like lactoylglutathione lyase family enzyme